MARCINCGKESRLISKPLEVCLDCIRDDFAKLSEVKIMARESIWDKPRRYNFKL